MSLQTISVSTEQAAEKLLADAREVDRSAYMYQADAGEFGFYVVCYYPPEETDDNAMECPQGEPVLRSR